MNKPYADAVLIGIVLFVLISFIRYLMIFFQKFDEVKRMKKNYRLSKKYTFQTP